MQRENTVVDITIDLVKDGINCSLLFGVAFFKNLFKRLKKIYLKKYFIYIILMTQTNKTDLAEANYYKPLFQTIINNTTDLKEPILNPDLVGDDLNKILEAVLIPDFQKKINDKAYTNYLKHQEYLKTYRRKHNEEITIKTRETYKNNEEYRQKVKENQLNRYYLMRYGITKEEHLKEKAKKDLDMIENYKKKIENKKSRLLSYEQFINKHDQKNIICN